MTKMSTSVSGEPAASSICLHVRGHSSTSGVGPCFEVGGGGNLHPESEIRGSEKPLGAHNLYLMSLLLSVVML